MSKTIYDEKNWKTNIAYLLTSQAISMIGTMLVQYAIIWHVTLSTQSGTMVGLMSALGILPMIVVMPFAGALADHYDRKKIAILSDSCVALASLFMAILLMIDFVTAVIGVTMLFFRVTVPPLKSLDTNKINVLAEIKSGIKYLRIHKILIALILVGFMGSVFSTPAANLAPLQITRNFHDGLWQLSAIEIGFASGMLVGGSVMSTWGGFKNKIKTIALGYSLLVIPFILLGLTSNFWLYFAMMVAIGFVVPISRTAMVSFFQAKTDHAHMGRVMSLVTMAISIASPATMLILGPLADVISIDWIMTASGLFLMPLVLWLLVGKSFRF